MDDPFAGGWNLLKSPKVIRYILPFDLNTVHPEPVEGRVASRSCFDKPVLSAVRSFESLRTNGVEGTSGKPKGSARTALMFGPDYGPIINNTKGGIKI